MSGTITSPGDAIKGYLKDAILSRIDGIYKSLLSDALDLTATAFYVQRITLTYSSNSGSLGLIIVVRALGSDRTLSLTLPSPNFGRLRELAAASDSEARFDGIRHLGQRSRSLLTCSPSKGSTGFSLNDLKTLVRNTFTVDGLLNALGGMDLLKLPNHVLSICVADGQCQSNLCCASTCTSYLGWAPCAYGTQVRDAAPEPPPTHPTHRTTATAHHP